MIITSKTVPKYVISQNIFRSGTFLPLNALQKISKLQWQQQHWHPDKKTHGESSSKSSRHPPPKAITLPFYQGTNNNFSKYVEVQADGGFGTKIGHMRVKKTKPIIPGWLVELKDHFLRGVMDIKSILEEGNQDVSVVDIVASLAKVINEDMEIEISDIEIFRILKRIPRDCDGYFSFPHFMYGLGNPTMATEKGVFTLTQRKFDGKTESVFSKKAKEKAATEDEQSCGDQKRREKDEEEGEGRDEDELDAISKECLEKSTKNTENIANVPDETGYSLREKVFFSGLLIFEMYETLKEVENLYALSKIPEPAGIEQERNRKRGFGQENIGKKNPKEAAWDKPLPEIPKLSPYLTSIPFVTTRWNTSKPGPHAKLKRTWSKLQPLHLAIRPPRKLRHPICITENQARVRQALAYLAAQGDCVALLPDIHFVIHLSDTDVDKLEVVTIRDDPEDDEDSHHSSQNPFTEKQFILVEANKLYRPHQLPKQITKLTSTITYTDGLQLREIVKFMQQEHWKCISLKKLEFREKVWVRMHVDEMPGGRMRDSFIYAFVTYLPYVSHLPVINSTVRPYVGRHSCTKS